MKENRSFLKRSKYKRWKKRELKKCNFRVLSLSSIHESKFLAEKLVKRFDKMVKVLWHSAHLKAAEQNMGFLDLSSVHQERFQPEKQVKTCTKW